MGRHLLIGLIFASGIVVQPASASSIVDGCAPALRHDELTFTNDLAATFAYMNTVTASNFNQQSASAALSAVIEAVPVSFDFSYFSQKRSQLMQMANYNHSIKQQQSYLMRYLSSNSSAAYAACVTALLQQPTVLLQPVNETSREVLFRLYFKGSNDAAVPYDLSLTVLGGTVVNPVAAKWSGTATQDITVRRSRLNEDVSINVNATLQGVQKYSDSILFTTPAVYEKKYLVRRHW